MNVAVLGSGTMGRGIAQISAVAGHDVACFDLDDTACERAFTRIDETLERGVELGKVTWRERDAALGRLTATTELSDAAAGADLVIEAVPEDISLKKDIFADVEAIVADTTVIATNTSSLSVTAIASSLDSPERAIGLHFFNPPHLMELVEVVLGERTSKETRDFATSYVDGTGKTPVVVRDSPGFASSRLGLALGVEAIRMVEEGVASPRAIDSAKKLGYNHPMGPIELTDHVGLDVRLDALEYLHSELGERFRPPQLLKRNVRAGKLGRKTGEGFYHWKDGEIVEEPTE